MSDDSLRKEPVFVLYGSQTGNSEQAAEDFSKQMEEKFTPSYFKDLGLEPVRVETTCIQLDDFLDYKHAAFTKTMVVFVSSYGVGQAPIGSYKFRSFVEELISRTEGGKAEANDATVLLEGLKYALCGLGDSRYTTYLVNPTTIDKGLTVAGATRIGAMGKADAKQIGENSQENVIAKWKEEMWIPLAKSIAAVTVDENKNSEEAKTDIMKEMQAATIPILMKIDPDYTPPKEFGGRSAGAIPTNLLLVAIIMAVIATLFVTGKIQVP
mmetsp:Transcript_20070/g.43677  ORF Transcript_20070/g.43677 Transcript_20070/m.43677 type:complete len:268 (-) Transcript_20070:33-836(-)|eukprot:CAMPEP_0168202122 /NCGR_PEP_ID=MMETSP0139_2-20121125/24102_1 /TAXON_ID=44445 /ORGANISM="Pseudo-nitzschia australis, Strain 10249 10 AB" /LENGTH=267 /DNA_ID=CAMNT_0008127785 /DNA_START=181 /DNA_END=984 /DNA_ORIENTATION=-